MTKKVKIIIVAACVVLVLLVVVLSVNQKGKQVGSNNQGTDNKVLVDQTPEASQATQQLISEVTTAASSTKPGITGPETISIASDGASSTTAPIKAVIVNQGTSPINVETGKVITKTGAAVVNNVIAGSQQAPQQSVPLDLTKTVVPSSAIMLDAKKDGFSPKEFTVNRGQLVSLVVTNVNDGPNYEILMFDDPSLQAVAVAMLTGNSKSISFNAPTKAGEYTFYSAQLNHRALGAVGKMIVK